MWYGVHGLMWCGNVLHSLITEGKNGSAESVFCSYGCSSF